MRILELEVAAEDRERVETHLRQRGWVFDSDRAKLVETLAREKALRGVWLRPADAAHPLVTLYTMLGFEDPEARATIPLTDAPLGQHFLRDLKHLDALLPSLTKYAVVEIGVGKGALTNELLQRKPRRLVGIEIEPALVPASIRQRIELIEGDARDVDYEAIVDGPTMLVAAPPYSLLTWLREQLLPRFERALVMVPTRREAMFPELKRVARLDGDAFDPPSEGAHLWLAKTPSLVAC